MYQAIIEFWFEELSPAQWWQKDEVLDQQIKQRFLPYLEQAMRGECVLWRNSVLGRLAEIIVLDQFSRNIYRDTPQAFSQDAMALVLSQEAIKHDIAKQLTDHQLGFAYMPFMHSESKVIHADAVPLFDSLNEKSYLDFELQHKAIIDRFGRYPHRNPILNRSSTPEEIDFLKEPGSSF